MAGWKLRKDKTESETPQAEDAAEAATSTSEVIALQAEDAAAHHASAWEAPSEESEQEPAHDPARFLDLSEEPSVPTDEYLAHSQMPHTEAAPEIEEEDPLQFTEEDDPAVIPMPPPPLPEPAADETGAVSSTLRMDRAELASALPAPSESAIPTAIPTVAPFILDVPPVAAVTTHRLIVQIGRLSAPFDLTKEVTIIGRPDSSLNHYPDVEIELDDAISRRHAEIIRHGEAYYVADSGSTNGSLLNGEALPPHEERLLAHGDRIRLGERTEIIFE